MYRLMRIEKEKARERMTAGGRQIFVEGDKGQALTLVRNLTKVAGVPLKSAEGGEAKDKTAETFGIGPQTGRPEAFRSRFTDKCA